HRAPRGRDEARPGRAGEAARACLAHPRRREPRVQPGLAHRARPAPAPHRFRGGRPLRPGKAREPRRTLPRRPGQARLRFLEAERGGEERAWRRDARRAAAHPGDAWGTEAGHRGDEVKATFSIWRGDAQGGAFRDYSTEVSEGMVVLDAVHRIQAEQANDLA